MAIKGLQPMSAKIAAWILAALLLLIVFIGEPTGLARGILLVGASFVLFAEIGWKKLMGARDSPITLISGILILALFVVGMLGIAGIPAPGFLRSATNFLLVITAGWIVLESFM